MNSLRRFLSRYRTPLLLALGGISALFAWRGRQEQAAAATATAAPPPAGDGGAAYQLGVSQGAQLYGAGVAQGIAPTEQALGLAGATVGGAISLAQGAQAMAAGISGDWAGLGGAFVNAITSLFTPVPVPSAQPAATQPVPATPAPVQPPPTPAPAADRFVRYEVVVGSSNVRLFVVSAAGALAQTRYAGPFRSGSWAPVDRRVDGGRLHWRTTSGGYTGWSYVPGDSVGSWSIRKRFARADGTTYTTPIGQTGS